MVHYNLLPLTLCNECSESPEVGVLMIMPGKPLTGTRVNHMNQPRDRDIVFQELYIELSYLCNARCRHCYVSAGPDADPASLEPHTVLSLIDQAADIDAIIPRIAIAGGEPTLFWNDLMHYIRYASAKGLDVILISNGWWGHTRRDCDAKLRELVAHGLTRLELSTSVFHREFVDVSAINNIVDGCVRYNVPCDLHIRTDRFSGPEENLALLGNRDKINIVSLPIMPMGRAKTDISRRAFDFSRKIPSGNCKEAFSFLINPHGDCFPCCGGTELASYLKIGNIKEETLGEIVQRCKRRKLLRYLFHNGPSKMAQAMGLQGDGGPASDTYVTICDLCSDLFQSPGSASALERWVNCPHASAKRMDRTFRNQAKSTAKSPTNLLFQPELDTIDLPRKLLNKMTTILQGSLDTISTFALRQPSGAFLFTVDDCYIKVAESSHATRLDEQFSLLTQFRDHGLRCVPEVYFRFTNASGMAGYVMKRYHTHAGTAAINREDMIERMIECLKQIWQLPPGKPPIIDWDGYIHKVKTILAGYDNTCADRMATIGAYIQRINASTKSCMTHGDPTFENIVFDRNGAMVMLDPNPQLRPSVPIAELDFAKVMQSAFGWEEFIYGRRRNLDWCEELLPIANQLFGAMGWQTCSWLLITHLIRTLPYGAKIENAAALVPSITAFTSHLERHL